MGSSELVIAMGETLARRVTRTGKNEGKFSISAQVAPALVAVAERVENTNPYLSDITERLRSLLVM